jgi:DNA-binding PadR family transcriptional regulator
MKTSLDELLPLSEQTYFILLSLGSSPKHGYAITKDIQSLSNGRVTLSVSTLYTTLKRLLDAGWIRLAEEPSKNSNRPRKVYELTNPGGRVLNAEVKRLKALISAARMRKVERVI